MVVFHVLAPPDTSEKWTRHEVPTDRPWQTAEEWFYNPVGIKTSKFKLSQYRNELFCSRSFNHVMWSLPSKCGFVICRFFWALPPDDDATCWEPLEQPLYNRRWGLNFHEIVWSGQEMFYILRQYVLIEINQVATQIITWAVKKKTQMYS